MALGRPVQRFRAQGQGSSLSFLPTCLLRALSALAQLQGSCSHLLAVPRKTAHVEERVIPFCVSFLKTGQLSQELTLASYFCGMAIALLSLQLALRFPPGACTARPWHL